MKGLTQQNTPRQYFGALSLSIVLVLQIHFPEPGAYALEWSVDFVRPRDESRAEVAFVMAEHKMIVSSAPDAAPANAPSQDGTITVKERTIKFSGWSFSATLPAQGWKPDHMTYQSSGGRCQYTFERDAIKDSAGRDIVPSIGFVFEETSQTDAVLYYLNWREATKDLNIKQQDIFIWESGLINLQNAVGYKGNYAYGDGPEQTVYVVNAIHKTIGVTVVMDATTEIFGLIEPEFRSVLKSLQFETSEGNDQTEKGQAEPEKKPVSNERIPREESHGGAVAR